MKESEKAIFAAGCFWGTEYYFVFPDGQRLIGIGHHIRNRRR